MDCQIINKRLDIGKETKWTYDKKGRVVTIEDAGKTICHN
ncbi:hypothetical protein AXE41_RS06375 [Acinetobacter baumannii]|nr:hypothetical protein [Acinetobacter baumannii]EHU1923435.1 hypothetical protein [Acinetobacter baumannii]EHU1988192.1 hypothetical protein [Acinetobacter baumannii]EHU2638107.1 hypothetical protein [Acinetobacter baumannii]EHU3101369.1 hypothetical protein [Acinetobacter baumannii]